MNSCKKKRTFTGALWRKNLLECLLMRRRRMNRSCHRLKRKGRTGHRKSLLTLRRSFPCPSPSCARFAVSNFSSITRTDVQDQRRIIRRCRCCSLTTAKWWRSRWPCRVLIVGYVIFRSTASKSADCVPPYGRTYIFSNKYHFFWSSVAK